MNRHLNVLAVAGLLLLAACSTPQGGQTDQASGSASSAASGAASAAASGPASSTASAACTDAFAALADMDITSLSDLGDLAAVEPTVVSCESVADWMAGASGVVDGEIRTGTARMLLAIRCSNPSLSSTPICQELASS